MDLITADPSTVSATTSSSSSSSAAPPPYAAASPRGTSPGSALGKPAVEKRSKRAALMQIQNDTISAAKAALNPVRTNMIMGPQKNRHKQKKPVSYAQLARSIHELAAASDQVIPFFLSSNLHIYSLISYSFPIEKFPEAVGESRLSQACRLQFC